MRSKAFNAIICNYTFTIKQKNPNFRFYSLNEIQLYDLSLLSDHGLSSVPLQQKQLYPSKRDGIIRLSSHRPLERTRSEPPPYSHSPLILPAGHHLHTQHHLSQQYHKSFQERLKQNIQLSKVRQGRCRQKYIPQKYFQLGFIPKGLVTKSPMTIFLQHRFLRRTWTWRRSVQALALALALVQGQGQYAAQNMGHCVRMATAEDAALLALIQFTTPSPPPHHGRAWSSPHSLSARYKIEEKI